MGKLVKKKTENQNTEKQNDTSLQEKNTIASVSDNLYDMDLMRYLNIN